jgi:hypothetical protein
MRTFLGALQGVVEGVDTAVVQLRSLLILVAATLSIVGCGSGATAKQESPEQRRVADLAHKCDEPESAVENNVSVFLRTAKAHGRGGSSAEATEALSKVVNYAGKQGTTPANCKGLLAALIEVGKHAPRGRVCFPYETGRVCFVSPSAHEASGSSSG